MKITKNHIKNSKKVKFSFLENEVEVRELPLAVALQIEQVMTQRKDESDTKFTNRVVDYTIDIIRANTDIENTKDELKELLSQNQLQEILTAIINSQPEKENFTQSQKLGESTTD